MPALEQALQVAVAQLRERIEKRRENHWHVVPIDTPWERRRNRERLAETYAAKIKSGEFFGADALPELRADRTMKALGRAFIAAAESGNVPIVRCYIEEGFPANWQDPVTGETALHGAAGTLMETRARSHIDRIQGRHHRRRDWREG